MFAFNDPFFKLPPNIAKAAPSIGIHCSSAR